MLAAGRAEGLGSVAAFYQLGFNQLPLALASGHELRKGQAALAELRKRLPNVRLFLAH